MTFTDADQFLKHYAWIDAVTPHEHFMLKAIQIAIRNPASPFGSILVDRSNNEVVAEGVNSSNRNPILHGEIDAIIRCADLRPRVDWTRLTLYTTAEPCCMCQGAIVWSGISLVVFGTSIATLIEYGWHQIAINASEVIRSAEFAGCDLIGGVMEAECNRLFANP